MAGRTEAHVTELDAAHAVMISHPDVVADVIMQAASPRPLVSGRVA
jgi:hypothetical protein